MSKANNLTDFLTDTANAIRAKKGTSAKINPQNFANEIASIPTGSEIVNTFLYLYLGESVTLDLAKKLIILNPYDIVNIGTVKLTYTKTDNATGSIFYDNLARNPMYVCFLKQANGLLWISSEVGEFVALSGIKAVTLEVTNVTDERSYNAAFDMYSMT